MPPSSGQVGKGRTQTERLLLVAQRDSWTCWLCGEPVDPSLVAISAPLAASVDHVIPKRNGGTNRYENLRLAHQLCNSRRGHADPQEFGVIAAALHAAPIEDPSLSTHANLRAGQLTTESW